MPVDEEYLQKVMRTLSHDVGSALRAASGFSEMLLSQYTQQLDEKAIHWLSLIKSEGDKAQGQLVALSRYARLYGVNEPKARCDLAALCHQAMKEVSYVEIAKKMPEFSVQVDQLPVLSGYHNLWVMLFLELLINSACYARSSSAIVCRVYCQESDEAMDIIVEDNGQGIASNQLDQALLPFRTIVEKDSDKQAQGMGMSVVKRIAQLHGGDLVVQNIVDAAEGESCGLRAIIRIPK